MSNQKLRKVFAIEKAMRNQQAGVNRAVGSFGMMGSAPPFDLMEEIKSIREEMAEIKQMLANNPQMDVAKPSASSDDTMDRELRTELAGMIKSISKAKSELAAIKHPDSDDDRIMAASNELDAIVLATEHATNTILEATESVEKKLHHMAVLANDDQDILLIVDKIINEITRILEACNFQDITGQRVTKVVQTMQFIEERILAMIDIWGFESLIDIPISGAIASDDEGIILNGPQSGSEAISQADIDALFD